MSRTARVVFAASDPVLLLSELPGVFFEASTRQETPMDAKNKVGCDWIPGTDLFDSKGHGIDVA